MKINVVLFEPEIPQNTGNIIGTCIASGASLHLIMPLGFSLEDKFLKRASVNFLKECKYSVYENWEKFIEINNPKKMAFYTRFGNKIYTKFNFNIKDKIYIIFGSESKGIRKNILKDNINECYRIPMTSQMRSLNLANAVVTIVYDCLRQINFEGLSSEEVQYGKNYLNKFKE